MISMTTQDTNLRKVQWNYNRFDSQSNPSRFRLTPCSTQANTIFSIRACSTVTNSTDLVFSGSTSLGW